MRARILRVATIFVGVAMIDCGGASPQSGGASMGPDGGSGTTLDSGALFDSVGSGGSGDGTTGAPAVDGGTGDALDASATNDGSGANASSDAPGTTATNDASDAGGNANASDASANGDAAVADASDAGGARDATEAAATSDASDASSVGDASDSGAPVTGQMYVINAGPQNNDGAILRFASPATITGNVAPRATISGAASTLLCPHFGFLDVPNNRLYVGDPCAAAVDVFDAVSTLNGAVAPTRRIAGSATTFAPRAPFNGNPSMMAVAVDTTRDILYVSTSNQSGSVAEIAVFAGASTVLGNVAPTRVITTPTNPGRMLNFNHGVLSDAANDRLYVASLRDSSVLVFDGASTAGGSMPPVRWVSGTSTGLAGNDPIFMQLDASGDLIVDCRSAALTPTTGLIEVFAASHFLSAVSGNVNVGPVRTAITGSMTTLAGPHMIAYEADSDELYVANAFGGDVLAFSSFASAAGNVAPTRVLGGSNTGLSIPQGAPSPRTATGIFLDPTR